MSQSRIAKNPVEVPGGVDVTLGNTITVKGPLGSMFFAANEQVEIKLEENRLVFVARNQGRSAKALSGTMRAVVANMVKGVTQGFERKLTLVGVGYKAQAKGDTLSLALGYSHPVEYVMPDGVKVETPTQTEILLKGIDKQLVGQVAAEIRAFREPEPYKGKGVRYAGEVVVIKETKKK
jgi:large subunit ribosomal protein L6